MNFWLGLAVLIIVVLVGIAIRLHWKLHKQSALQREQERIGKQKEAEKADYLNTSIQVLAQGLLEEQLTITEGCIRISVLLSYFPDADDYKSEFIAFYQVANKTAHIPILDDWKKLSAKRRLAYDKERLSVESEYKDFVNDAARRILGRWFFY